MEILPCGFGEIRLPKSYARHLTKRERVTNINRSWLMALMSKGQITHIIDHITGVRRICRHRDTQLEIGQVVERYLRDGDRIIINRQPTLHCQSMMGYRVKLGEEFTIALHMCYTSPMNCDFDGDENNAWDPQDVDVEAEVEMLVNVTNNLMSGENNKPTMGLVMNAVVGSYLMTALDLPLSAKLMKVLMSYLQPDQEETLATRLLAYKVNPQSTRAIYSALFPHDFFYDEKGVLITDGIIVSGALAKAHVSPSRDGVIHKLWKRYGRAVCVKFLTEAPWVINKWLIETGFCLSLHDLEFKETVRGENVSQIVNAEYDQLELELDSIGGECKNPVDETIRQRSIDNLVNITQGVGLRISKEILSGDNFVGYMSDQGSGSKGNIANIGQMMGLVGQQYTYVLSR